MPETKAKPQEPNNVWLDDIAFGKDSVGYYELTINGPTERAQMTRRHKSNSDKEIEHTDDVTYGKGGNATYKMKVSGKIEGARITRMHKC